MIEGAALASTYPQAGSGLLHVDAQRVATLTFSADSDFIELHYETPNCQHFLLATVDGSSLVGQWTGFCWSLLEIHKTSKALPPPVLLAFL